MTANLKALARFTDSLGFLYLEHAVIEREDASVAAFTEQGRISLPAATLSCLMLGPGTRITHAAVHALADCGCVVVWVGEDGLRHYAAGQNKTRSSNGIERQCRLWADPDKRLAAVRLLYELRFKQRLPTHLTLQQIRGREGARVRDAYRAAADRYGVQWSGRNYDRSDWGRGDPVNRALSAANAALYALCLAALHAYGYSPALGFIHVGKQLSFVYDLADIFKLDTAVPAAFEAAAKGADQVESRARGLFRDRCRELHLLDQISAALRQLFGGEDDRSALAIDGEVALPGGLWDPGGDVPGGVTHGHPDP